MCYFQHLSVISTKLVNIDNAKRSSMVIVKYGFVVLKCVYKIVYKHNKLFMQIFSTRKKFLVL